MSANAINVIGYQLEKVHVGLLTWLLRSQNGGLSDASRAQVLQRLDPSLPAVAITRVDAFPEYSFGRRKHVDLVVKIHLSDGTCRALVVECKVDGDVDSPQLQASGSYYRSEPGHEDRSVRELHLVLGAGTATIPRSLPDQAVIDIEKLLSALDGVSDPTAQPLLDQWREALSGELRRQAGVEIHVRKAGGPWESTLIDEGYRRGFPVFYLCSAALRRKLQQLNDTMEEWRIYSGGNNPVLNLGSHWIDSTASPNPIQLFWEFNWDKWRLKAHVPASMRRFEAPLRDQVAQLLKTLAVGGTIPTRRSGEWISLHSWPHDFGVEPFDQVAHEVIAVVTKVHPHLEAELGRVIR